MFANYFSVMTHIKENLNVKGICISLYFLMDIVQVHLGIISRDRNSNSSLFPNHFHQPLVLGVNLGLRSCFSVD